MSRRRPAVPLKRMSERCATGIFVKNTSDWLAEGTVAFPHRDDYFMLLVLFEGEARVVVDFRDIVIRAGQGLVLAPGQIHFLKSRETEPDAWCLFVTPDNIAPQAQLSLESYSLTGTPVDFDCATLADMGCLFGMLRRRRSDTDFSRAMVSALVRLFCHAGGSEKCGSASRYIAIVLKLRHLLGKHMASEKRPAAYADMLCISGVYLNEAVKAVTGMSVSGFIRAQVVLAAKRQLAYSSLTVMEIAASLGYDDCSYFSRLFRKEAGVTPTGFRKNLG